MSSKRIGIFGGSFDPIHAGHIRFALEAAKYCRLDKVVFLPERRPPNKPEVEHFAHRLAMIKSAIKPYNNLELIDLPEKSFSTIKTIPELTKRYLGSELFYLVGSSNVRIMATPSWKKKDLERYFKSGNLIVALRGGDKSDEIKNILKSFPYQPEELVIFPSSHKDTSSTKIREGLKENRKEQGLLPSVYRYVQDQWLYVSLREG